MELAEWIQTSVATRLIVRMELKSFSNTEGPGSESVRASLVGYKWTNNGPLMAHVYFERFGGGGIGSPYIDVEDDPAKFVHFIKHSVIWQWEQRRDPSWDAQTDKIFQLKTRANSDGTGIKRHTLHASNVLVLQHLAHIQGAIGQTVLKFDNRQSPVLVHMTHVLGTIITQGNKELMRLTQMN
jgi:hypothetical protein